MNPARQVSVADLTELAPNGEAASRLRIVNPDPNYLRPKLIEPTTLGYLYIAGRVRNGTGAVVLPDRGRTKLLVELKNLARELERVDGVVKAAVFRAIVIPPTARFSAYLKTRGESFQPAAFDVMILVQTTSVASAHDVQLTPAFGILMAAMRKNANRVTVLTARNARRIADVEISPEGLFLFNHFVAADPRVMLPLWEHLAAWYVAETGLTNSVALAPACGERSDYQIVNWARWDSSPLRHFWRQLSKRSFWRYVTANLDANRAASMPIYCRFA